MTDHLAECEAYRDECGGGCICHHVCACEQRVKRTGRPLWHLKGATWGHEQGWNEALDAAREAVETISVRKDASWDMRVQALAAIDALREKP